MSEVTAWLVTDKMKKELEKQGKEEEKEKK